MNKKAISPLVATVLLIGFVVIVAAAVWMWYGNVLKEQMEKQGALTQIKSDCVSQIELSVLSAIPTSTGFNVEIKNTGTAIFNGIKIIAHGDKEGTLTEKESFNAGEQKTLKFNTEIVANKIDVMPMIVRQGVAGICADKKVTADLT